MTLDQLSDCFSKIFCPIDFARLQVAFPANFKLDPVESRKRSYLGIIISKLRPIIKQLPDDSYPVRTFIELQVIENGKIEQIAKIINDRYVFQIDLTREGNTHFGWYYFHQVEDLLRFCSGFIWKNLRFEITVVWHTTFRGILDIEAIDHKLSIPLKHQHAPS